MISLTDRVQEIGSFHHYSPIEWEVFRLVAGPNTQPDGRHIY